MLRRSSTHLATAVALLLGATACDSGSAPAEKKKADAKAADGKADEAKRVNVDPKGKPGKSVLAKSDKTPEQAKAFVEKTDKELKELWTRSAKAQWTKATDITDEHDKAAAELTAEVMAYETKAIAEAATFDGVKADPDTRRQLDLLKVSSTVPAPNDATKRKELADITAKLESTYGKGKFCADPKDEKTCQDLGQLSGVLAQSRDYDEQLKAWEGWRTISVPMKEDYTRFVELGNEGAKAIGFGDMGQLWRSRYDMTPEAFEQEMDRLWAQVKPLYEELHCHIRAKLSEQYGADKVPADGMIPAHLSGNMWTQDFSNLYPMLEPYKGQPSIDVTEALKKKKTTELEMVKMGEAFFTSMGLNELPETFWERSMFVQPKDRDVVCHASAWDVTSNNDLRIKMCIKVNHEDLVTIHHELGHNYYYNNYYTKPVLYQQGAHDGFHEAIGDAIALSITPKYLNEIGLLGKVSESDEAVINKQMQDALAKIAFLPFGKMIDQWRWDVFAGKVKPEQYNAHWWKLRAKYQGVMPPSERGEDNFDPGAKYHIPANTPYARYFLAHILQFQFHKAMCDASGHEGPLHTCSVYGSKEAGTKLAAMLAMGSSQPWPDALEKLTGTREMDAAAVLEYFEPLMGYLKTQNEGRTCGWNG
jgi:peptidyl-dipeptidase A